MSVFVLVLLVLFEVCQNLVASLPHCNFGYFADRAEFLLVAVALYCTKATKLPKVLCLGFVDLAPVT